MKKDFLKKSVTLSVAAIAALGMIFPAANVASAATVTINGDANDTATHNYDAYQIFSGTISDNALVSIQWGSGVDGDALLAALKADTSLGADFTACSSASDVADVLSSYTSDSDQMKKFAQLAGQKLSSTKVSGTTSITINDAGYYLIKDASAVSGNGASTSFIVKVISEDISINVKSAIPSLEKKVKEDGSWADVADYSIGDTVDFQLTGTVASNYADYTTYKYVFSDTISDAFTYVDADSNGKVDVTVTIDGDVVDASKYTVKQNGQSFTVTFANLKDTAATASSKVVVSYSAVLDSDAVIGNNGNENTANLTYSNNPNVGGEGETGTTPDDKVVVLTYRLDIEKVDGKDSTALQGVEFKLKNAGGKYITVDGNSKVTGADETGSVFTTDASGKFSVIGLEDGVYTLVETKPLDGYNPLADQTLTITATIVAGEWTGTEAPLTGITLNGEAGTNGTVSMTVENNKGSLLPSTGGMGTTILYIVGGIMVVGAGITLVVKTRAKNEDAE
ncbi:MAG: isopeptide-forming domain-containing fimbrial protein [Lachnospiraceae bacterium]